MSNEEFQKLMLENFSELKSDVNGIRCDIAEMKSDIAGLKNDVISIEKKVDFIENKVNSIEKKVNSIYDETANLIEFKTEIDITVNEVKKDLSIVEIVTASNYAYIAKLKIAK